MKNFITNRQIFMILYCIISGYSIINLPQRVAESAGTGGWVTLLISTILFIFITYVITYLQYVYEGKTLYEYSQQLIGKFLTYVLTASYIIYFFIFFTMIIRRCCDTIRLTILTKTPTIYICLLMYIVVGYVLSNNLNVIARLCEIYGLISIISIIVISSIIFTQGEIVNIKPLFITNNIMVYLRAIFKMVLPFLGMEIMFAIPISRNINKNIFKYTMISVGFIGILFIYVVESAFSVGGVSLLINSSASLLNISKGIDVPYLEFFRRLDGIHIVSWTMNAVCATSLWGYGTVIFINKIFKNIKYKFIVIITTAVSFLVSQLPKATDQVESIMELNTNLGCVLIFIIPCILLLITKVKKYDKNLS
jgi:spore germination protein